MSKSRLQTLKRRTLVLSGVIVVLTGILVFRPSAATTQVTEDLPTLVAGFSGPNAASIEIEQTTGKGADAKQKVVRLQKRTTREGGDAWVVTTAFDYPANETSVSRLLSELAKARVAGESTRRPEAFADYAEGGAWTRVTIQDAADKDLVVLGVGTSSWKSGETNVLLEKDQPPRVVRVRNFSGDSASTRPESWFESRLFPGLESAQVESFEVVQKVEVDGKPATRVLSFKKRPQEAAAPSGDGKPAPPPPERGWDLVAPEPGPASRVDVEDLVRAFTGMLFEEVVGRPKGDEDAAKHGFDAPEVTATAVLAPEQPGAPARSFVLTIGKQDPEKKTWFARRGSLGRGEVRTDPWVFTLRDASETVGRFRNDPSKYKEAPKKEPAKDGAPPGPAGGPPGPAPAPEMGSPDGPPKEPAAPPPAPAAPGTAKPPEPAPPPAPPAPPEKPETPK